jgi:signal transduction histidine kinase
MNAVIGMTELAIREYGIPKGLEYLKEIKTSGANLLSIINDILDFSKIEAGNLQIRPTPYELSSVISDVINIINIQIGDKPIEFISDMDAALPGKLIGDSVRVRQILLNILSNAVKYTERGFVKFSASFEKVGDKEVKIIFEVKDTGIGIKENNMDKLFGNFVRFEEGRLGSIEGTGLGLAITRGLCNAMGGEIKAVSEYGKGSLFTVIIIQGCEDFSPANITNENRFAEKNESEARFAAPEAAILAVDDVAANLKIIKGLLAPYKLKVDTCGGGFEALRMLKEKTYDFVFMDHMMPDMDGVEVTAAIRAMPGDYFKQVPIIALTANAMSGMKEFFLQNGFSDYLAKPVEISKLNEIMDRWIPKEKWQPIDASESIGVQSAYELKIEGLDIARGIKSTGNSFEGYLDVLRLFVSDAEKRLEMLAKQEDLSSVAKNAHALKSTAGSIGAADLSAAAADLENAGKSGDKKFVAQNIKTFLARLTGLLQAIKTALPSISGEESAKEPLDYGELLRLKSLLTDENINVNYIDKLIKEILNKSLSSADRDIITSVKDRLLISDFESAAKVVASYLVKQ